MVPLYEQPHHPSWSNPLLLLQVISIEWTNSTKKNSAKRNYNDFLLAEFNECDDSLHFFDALLKYSNLPHKSIECKNIPHRCRLTLLTQ